MRHGPLNCRCLAAAGRICSPIFGSGAGTTNPAQQKCRLNYVQASLHCPHPAPVELPTGSPAGILRFARYWKLATVWNAFQRGLKYGREWRRLLRIERKPGSNLQGLHSGVPVVDGFEMAVACMVVSGSRYPVTVMQAERHVGRSRGKLLVGQLSGRKYRQCKFRRFAAPDVNSIGTGYGGKLCLITRQHLFVAKHVLPHQEQVIESLLLAAQHFLAVDSKNSCRANFP